MHTLESRLPLAPLDRFWAEQLGCAPRDLRGGVTRLVPCGQRQIQVLATPDGAVVIGLPHLIAVAGGATVDALLSPAFWAESVDLPAPLFTFFGPSSLSYVTPRTFRPARHGAVRLLERRDAGELARFARVLRAREPDIFHAWAIGGRVAANERLWGATSDGRLVSVAGLRQVDRGLDEVGINTLPRYRRRGWGTAVAGAATADGLSRGRLIQWSAPLNNEPSMRIAHRLGYLPYAHQLWLTPPEQAVLRGGAR